MARATDGKVERRGRSIHRLMERASKGEADKGRGASNNGDADKGRSVGHWRKRLRRKAARAAAGHPRLHAGRGVHWGWVGGVGPRRSVTRLLQVVLVLRREKGWVAHRWQRGRETILTSLAEGTVHRRWRVDSNTWWSIQRWTARRGVQFTAGRRGRATAGPTKVVGSTLVDRQRL